MTGMQMVRRGWWGEVMWFRLVCTLVVLLTASVVGADDSEHRLQQGVSTAIGSGFEMTYGNYGSNADATVVTVPVLLVVNPLQNVDLTLEVPLVYFSSRSSSDVVVTRSGGMGRRTNATVSLSSSSSTSSEAGLGDINLSAGWTVQQDEEGWLPRVRPNLYLKLPTGDDDSGLGTGTFEFGPGLSLSKWLGDFQLFVDGVYILQDSTSDYQGKNYLSYTAGAGVQLSDRLFASLFARGATTRVDGGDAPLEGRLKLNFLQSRRVAWELYGLAGFSDASPAVGGGLLVMYQF